MPIRRRDDGEIVDEVTETASRNAPRDAASSGADAPTEPVKSRGKQDADSLFEPKQRGGKQGNRLEDPTVPIGSDSRGDVEKTRVVPPRRRGPSSRVQAGADQDDPMLDPPVGWLVVVRGPGKGRVLSLGNGLNVMGRGLDSRVRVDFGDDTIARVNHARLVYEPRKRCYLLNHGDGANLTYLNGEVVTGTIEIESGAMIEMGETTLRFQAFCTAEFDWPDIDD